MKKPQSAALLALLEANPIAGGAKAQGYLSKTPAQSEVDTIIRRCRGF